MFAFTILSFIITFFFGAAQVTYNSQKREQRVSNNPGGGGVFDDPVLLSGDALQFRLNEIYNMSDDEDEAVVDVAGGTIISTNGCYAETTSRFNLESTGSRQAISGAPIYGNVRQVKIQLGV